MNTDNLWNEIYTLIFNIEPEQEATNSDYKKIISIIKNINKNFDKNEASNYINKYLDSNPINFNKDPELLAKWTNKLHNDVNRILNKPPVPLNIIKNSILNPKLKPVSKQRKPKEPKIKKSIRIELPPERPEEEKRKYSLVRKNNLIKIQTIKSVPNKKSKRSKKSSITPLDDSKEEVGPLENSEEFSSDSKISNLDLGSDSSVRARNLDLGELLDFTEIDSDGDKSRPKKKLRTESNPFLKKSSGSHKRDPSNNKELFESNTKKDSKKLSQNSNLISDNKKRIKVSLTPKQKKYIVNKNSPKVENSDRSRNVDNKRKQQKKRQAKKDIGLYKDSKKRVSISLTHKQSKKAGIKKTGLRKKDSLKSTSKLNHLKQNPKVNLDPSSDRSIPLRGRNLDLRSVPTYAGGPDRSIPTSGRNLDSGPLNSTTRKDSSLGPNRLEKKNNKRRITKIPIEKKI